MVLRSGVIAGVFLLGLVVGIFATNIGDAPDGLAETKEVLGLLDANYVERTKLNNAELNKAAVRGILDYLDDPYTEYLTPRQVQSFNSRLIGGKQEFVGVGAEVTRRSGEIVVLGPLPGSPAVRAGVRPGDVIVKVDGTSTKGMSLTEVVDLIKGPANTTVTLTVTRLEAPGGMNIAIEREVIVITRVSSRIQEPGIGYIRLDGYASSSGSDLREEILRLQDENVAGLVLDLRNNLGGLLDAAVLVTSEFLADGTVVNWTNADGSTERVAVNGAGMAYEIPLVVLVNGYTASAAEITAGALQDYDRAKIVGTRTFGKGSVNLLHTLESSGAGLYITTARWETPKGRLIEGNGIEPDVTVGFSSSSDAYQALSGLTTPLCTTYKEVGQKLETHQNLNEALKQLCDVKSPPRQVINQDVQLEEAIGILRSQVN